jgi:hypothetical protein
MLRGLRVNDAPILQRLCAGNSKLFLRLGALLQARLAFTQPALEQLVASESGKRLLADRRFKKATPEGFAALAGECGCTDAGLTMVDEQGGAEAGWRVVALEDEIGNPLLAETSEESPPDRTETESGGLVPPAFNVMVSSLAPALRGPVEGLLQARADDQRAAALEQLRYAMPPLEVVSELMPMLLVDAAELVRERACSARIPPPWGASAKPWSTCPRPNRTWRCRPWWPPPRAARPARRWSTCASVSPTTSSAIRASTACSNCCCPPASACWAWCGLSRNMTWSASTAC